MFSEPQVDNAYKEPDLSGAKVFAVEYLPGQFDQRADSAEQCIRFLNEKEAPTVRSAVTYMILGLVSDEDMEQAAADANIASMIEALPERYNYAATKAGANLSGGEKQRILISRALAGHPDLLILDDASSALDYKTDAALRRAIREHYPDMTTITIAQRISSVMSMDRILVMENGRMLGYGTHDELLASCEVYRDIYISQTGGDVNAIA